MSSIYVIANVLFPFIVKLFFNRFFFQCSMEDLFRDCNITRTSLFKYTENFTTKKNESFQMKNSKIFHNSAQNIDCGYSLEPPRRGGSNEYPQSMF